MDYSKLALMSAPALLELQEQVSEALKAKLDTQIAPGRTGTFTTKAGELIQARVEKRNRVTLDCAEISPMAGRKWRIGYSHFKIDPIERQAPLTPKFKVEVKPHVPVTSDESW